MRLLVLACVVTVLFGCPNRDGTGAQGPQGPQGEKGDQGDPGAAGTNGAAGADGVIGPKGDKGDKGDPGQVLVLDGGVVSGPAGPAGPAGTSVTVSPLDGGSACPFGGAQVVQLSDGGAVSVCNGAPGPQGMAGMNGAPGSVGPAGSAGPPGPTGAAFFSDGGPIPFETSSFAGFTAAAVNGNLGGRVGAHALCAAAYPGAHFCSSKEYIAAASPIAVPDAGVWVDPYFKTDPGQRDYSPTCAYWVNSTATSGSTGAIINALGFLSDSFTTSSDYGCATPRKLACCFAQTAARFVGFTPTSFNGNLGGRVGAHAKCAAAFAGSHFCNSNEYLSATSPVAMPALGAWVDPWLASAAGERDFSPSCAYWVNSTATSGSTGAIINTKGFLSDSFATSSDYGCATARPLACCQ